MCGTDGAWSACMQKETTAKDTPEGSSFREGDGGGRDWEFGVSRNGMDQTEAEDTKKRWQEYTEELYEKIFMTQIIMMV